MQSINSYRRAKQEAEGEKKQRPQPDWEPDSMELEQKRGRAAALNRQTDIFGRREQGLNRTPGVFEQTALFHVDGTRGARE